MNRLKINIMTCHSTFADHTCVIFSRFLTLIPHIHTYRLKKLLMLFELTKNM